jgi:F-type H+/Na+-transporting ATPase subunit alpha
VQRIAGRVREGSDASSAVLRPALDRTLEVVRRAASTHRPELRVREIGEVLAVGHGTARLTGLPRVRSEELVAFPDGVLGMAFNLDEDEVGVILLGDSSSLHAGAEARRTGRVVDVPVGHGVLGRTLDPTGRPLDGGGALQGTVRWPIERDAPPIMDRAAGGGAAADGHQGDRRADPHRPGPTGADPGRPPDRQVGHRARHHPQPAWSGGRLRLLRHRSADRGRGALHRRTARGGAMDYTTVVVAPGQTSPGLQFIAPYAATSIAEYFMAEGDDVLIVYDDLTHHAQAYRELSLLLRRPPGREAFPGDIFYVHSRLLERSTHLRPELGGGSLTALPIIETEAQNLSAYIPTNLISITDGQIYLSPQRFQKGDRCPRWTSGPRCRGSGARRSCRRTAPSPATSGSPTPSSRSWRPSPASGPGCVREILKQPQYEAMEVGRQVAVLVALNEGVFDDVPLDDVSGAEHAVTRAVAAELADILTRVASGASLEEDDVRAIERVATETIAARYRTDSYGDA